MNLSERVKYAQMKARHSKLLLPWYKKWWGVLGIIIVFLFIIDVIVIYYQEVQKIKNPNPLEVQKTLEEQRVIRKNAINGPGDNFYFGTTTPQVTIIEFSDFACPYCKDSAAGLRKVTKEFKDQVKLIYRDYPLHKNSLDLALAARCAGEQNKFWEMYDILFANQDRLNGATNVINTDLKSIALDLKLNTEQFNSCLDSQKYLAKIKNDFDDAEILSIKGTPSWYVNSYELTGYMSEEKIRELISGLVK
jgi:protein-disulfide isomerase